MHKSLLRELWSPSLVQRKLYEEVRGTDRTLVDIEKRESTEIHWITIVSGNILPRQLMEITSKLIAEKGLSIGRSHLDTVKDDILHPDDSYGCVTMLRLNIDEHPSSTRRDHHGRTQIVPPPC